MRTLYLKGKDLGQFAEACLALSPRVFLLEENELFIDLTPTLKFFKGEENWIAEFERLRESFSITRPYVVTDRFEWAKAFYIALDLAAAPVSPETNNPAARSRASSSASFKTVPGQTPSPDRAKFGISRTHKRGDAGDLDKVVEETERGGRRDSQIAAGPSSVPFKTVQMQGSRAKANGGVLPVRRSEDESDDAASGPFSKTPSDRAKQSVARTHKRDDAGDLNKVVEETERGGRSHSTVAAGPSSASFKMVPGQGSRTRPSGGVLSVRRSEDESDDAASGPFSKTPLIVPEGKSRELLFQLPIERLMAVGNPRLLSAESQDRLYLVSFMRRVGLNWISDFVRLDKAAISRRFGKLGVQIREWLEGEREVCLPTYIPHEPIKEFIDAEEIGSLEGLLLNLAAPFERISQRLLGRGKAAKSILLWFQFDGGDSHRELLQFHEPHRDPVRFLKMVEEYLHRCQWENPLTFLEIEICECVAFTSGQLSLFDTTENRMADLGQYVLTWRERFGEQAVGFADLKASYVPERSWEKVWPPKPKTKSAPALERPFLGLRPPILYSPPKPYEVHRNLKLVASEHLASEWWEEEGAYRRYFIAEPPQGKRLWIFWDYQRQQWFLQGSFD